MEFVDVNDGYGNPQFTLGVTAQSREWAIARGLIAGAKPFSAYGERTTTGAETNFAVWPDGNFILPPIAGLQLSIVSTSANDTNTTGSGVWAVQIHYLDNLLAEKIEIVYLNGLTPVLTVATNIRFVQCMHIWAANATTGGSAAGTISASNGGQVYSQINATETRCSSAFRMVPAGYSLRILAAAAGSTSGTAAASSRIRLVSNAIDGDIFITPVIWFPIGTAGAQDTSVSLNFPPQYSIPAGAVVGATHTTDKAATISVTWFGYLEPV